MSSGAIDARRVARYATRLDRGAQLQEATDALLVGLLDDVNRRLRREATDDAAAHRAVEELFLALRGWKLRCPPEQWRRFVAICREHPLLEMVHQDPFTHRAFSKPRGYAGDAVMMDFIYGREEFWTPPEAPPVGRRVFDYTTAAPASEGVRARRAWVARRIDALAERKEKPHVLAIAAGHLREANLSAAIRRNRLGRLVALDADGESLQEVEGRYGRFGVETVPAQFRRLLSNRCELGQFDLVYSTGLFDYLDQRIGRRLVSTMFQMLRPGGRLIVANFLPGIHDIGYMEAYMDWMLIYRDRRQMIELTMDIPEEEIARVQLLSEENRNIIFLEVRRG
jgi:SAM-dependent methyltransferase